MGTLVSGDVGTFKLIFLNKTFNFRSCKNSNFIRIDDVYKKLVEGVNSCVYIEL